jgi:hypothetical protein
MLYLQRFYMVHPFQDHLCELVACAAVQLAAKAEEVAVKTPSVVDALLSMYPGVFVSPITTEAPQTVSFLLAECAQSDSQPLPISAWCCHISTTSFPVYL